MLLRSPFSSMMMWLPTCMQAAAAAAAAAAEADASALMFFRCRLRRFDL